MWTFHNNIRRYCKYVLLSDRIIRWHCTRALFKGTVQRDGSGRN
ncbi:MAG: hypothetical protein ACK55Z_32745 [bacterium]